MNLKIYYFSGTGNSLAVSRKLEELLIVNSEVVNISTFEK
jgi:flavodoxin